MNSPAGKGMNEIDIYSGEDAMDYTEETSLNTQSIVCESDEDGNNNEEEALRSRSHLGDDEDVEQDVVMNELNVDAEEKYDDEDEDEEEEDDYDNFSMSHRHYFRDPRIPKRGKDANTELLDTFEFGETNVNTSENPTQKDLSEDLRQEAEKWLPSNLSSTAVLSKPLRRFVCVDYPGIVQNKVKAIATLGGIPRLAEARKTEGKVELNFRPDDPFCKPTIGSFNKTSNLLIKCKRRKLQEDTAVSLPGDGYEYKTEVVGVVEGLFDFKIPVDYQYLPVIKDKDGSMRELLSDIVLKFEDERAEYLSREVPLFAPPFNFSRRERPAMYFFQPDQFEEEEEDGSTIGTARKSRSGGTQLSTFKDVEVPQSPNQESMNNLMRYRNEKVKHCSEHVQKLFAERPLWTRTGLLANLPTDAHHLFKHVLPTIAFNIISGPWRHAWCKFGYDPRKHPEAKCYQVIDFRLRSTITSTVNINKYSNRFRVYRQMKVHHKQGLPCVDQEDSLRTDSSAAGGKASGEATAGKDSSLSDVNLKFQYIPTKLPPQKNMFYHVCDIFEDEIQKLLHQNDGTEKECTERDGWCVPDFTDMARDILMARTESLLPNTAGL